MEEEVLVSGAVVFRQRAGKTAWLLVKPGNEEAWQLPKGVVRRGESSVRTAIRTLAELAGMRGRIIDEAGRTTVTNRRNGAVFSRKLIYYLVQQKGKEAVEGNSHTTKLVWAEFSKAKERLTSTEKRILAQAKQAFSTWQKEANPNH